jgi:CspA family cold shock protein
MSNGGGRVRRPRGKRGFDDDDFGSSSAGGGGGWSPPPTFGGGGRDFGTRSPTMSPGFASGGPETGAVVKWYNGEKGFGFVEIADGGGDAFLHARVLERAGAKSVEPGTQLRVRTAPGQKGLQVTDVTEIGEVGPVPGGSGARAPRPPRPGGFGGPPGGGGGGGFRPAPGPDEGEEMRGTVKWYNPDKGFGFISPEGGGQDVFVHATALERSGVPPLAEGQTVTMRVIQGRKGPEAASISGG